MPMRVLVVDMDINAAAIVKEYIAEEIGFDRNRIDVEINLTDEEIKERNSDYQVVIKRDVNGSLILISAGIIIGADLNIEDGTLKKEICRWL